MLLLIAASVGFYIKPTDIANGNLLIGASVALFFFIWMPLFIYYRWKDKRVKDYMLTQENIQKMKAFSKDKKL